MNSSMHSGMLNKQQFAKETLKFSFITKIVLFLLFLAGMNFVNKFFYFIFLAFPICIFLKRESIKLMSNTIWFLLFSISLLIFWPAAHSSFTGFLRCFTYLLCYIIGCNLFSENDTLDKTEKKIRIICIILSLGPLIHMGLNFISNSGTDEYVRNTQDFWTGDKLAATGQAALGCMIIGIAFAFLFSSLGKKYKIFALLALGIVFAYNLILAGRTILFMMAIVAIVAMVYYLKTFSTVSKLLKVSFWIVISVVLILTLYSANIFGIKESFEDSNFYIRFFGKEYSDFNSDTRWDLKMGYLKYLFTYPWGGGKIHEEVGSYAHDLYLDTYDEAGVFAFIFVVIIAIGSITKFFKLFKNTEISFETKQLILCLYVVIHLEFIVEPILAGIPWFLALFCILYGMVSYLERETTKQEGERG